MANERDFLAELAAMRAQGDALGVPDPTRGQVMLPVNTSAAPPMGTTVDISDTAPVVTKRPLLGQGAGAPVVPGDGATAAPAVAPATGAVAAQPVVTATQPGAAPPQIQSSERDIQIAPKLTDEQKAAEQAAFDKQQAAIDKQAQIEADKAETEALQKETLQLHLAEQKQKADAEAEKIKEQSEAAVQNWLKSQDEFKAASNAKPPEESLGQRFVNAIAIGLGAYSAGMLGGQNQALSIISGERERRVRELERQADHAKDRTSLAGNAVQFFRQQGMDQRSASNAVRLQLLDDSDRKIDAMTSGFKNEEVLGRAQALKAANAAERQRIVNAQSLSEQNKEVRKYVTQAPAAPNAADQRAARGLEVEVPQGAGGQGGIKIFKAKTEPEAAKIRDAQKVAAGINSDLAAMEALVAGNPSINPSTRQKVEILNNSIRKKYIKLDELGVPTGKDLELSSVIGDPTSWTQRSSQTRDLINRTRRDAAMRLKQAYETQGFRE